MHGTLSLPLIASYGDFARQLVAEGILSDPWVDGAPRFRMTPLVIDRSTQAELYAAAEGIAAVHAEAAALCVRYPALVKRFFDLPPTYDLMWRMSAPAWHGIARADVFLTATGPQICELNSDTPSGEPEAVALNQVVDGVGAVLFDNPTSHLVDRVLALLDAALPEHGTRTVGIVYPTEFTDDLAVVELYARWFQGHGMRVVLGSPFNLHPDGHGGVAMFGIPCSIIWRHYKTDWWGERRTVWRSEPAYADAAPLGQALSLLATACAAGRCAVVNPFGAVLTQNKRMMALMWEELSRFSQAGRAAIRRYLPYTCRLDAVPPERLRVERTSWVLKSDYGCEGEEVVMGAEASPDCWNKALADAWPTRWIAQRRFTPVAARNGQVANYGVYLVGGRAAGLFTRLQAGSTDRSARCAPTMVRLP